MSTEETHEDRDPLNHDLSELTHVTVDSAGQANSGEIESRRPDVAPVLIGNLIILDPEEPLDRHIKKLIEEAGGSEALIKNLKDQLGEDPKKQITVLKCKIDDLDNKIKALEQNKKSFKSFADQISKILYGLATGCTVVSIFTVASIGITTPAMVVVSVNGALYVGSGLSQAAKKINNNIKSKWLKALYTEVSTRDQERNSLETNERDIKRILEKLKKDGEIAMCVNPDGNIIHATKDLEVIIDGGDHDVGINESMPPSRPGTSASHQAGRSARQGR